MTTANTITPHPSRRFGELDGFRGVAAFAVVLYHFDGLEPEAPSLPLVEYGEYGVQLFFMISGFVILMSASRSRRVIDFAISRFSRLYPPYWIALAMSTLLLFLFRVPIASGEIGPAQVAINVTMIQRWLLQPNVDQVYWTLGVEMQFYFIVGFLLFATKCNITPKLVGMGAGLWTAIVLAVAVLASPHTHGNIPSAAPTVVKILLNGLVVPYGALFSAGMLAFLGRTHDRRWFAGAWASGLVAALSYGLLQSWLSAGIVAGVVILFILVTMLEQVPLLTWRPIRWLGRLSYSLYIGHLAVSYVVFGLLRPFIPYVAAYVLAMVVVFLWSWAIHRVGEEWASKKLRSKLTELAAR